MCTAIIFILEHMTASTIFGFVNNQQDKQKRAQRRGAEFLFVRNSTPYLVTRPHLLQTQLNVAPAHIVPSSLR